MKDKDWKEAKKEVDDLRDALRVKYCNFKEEIEHFGKVVVNIDEFLNTLGKLLEDRA